MTDKVITGPPDSYAVPHQPIGTLLYNGIKSKAPNRIALISGECYEEISYGQLFDMSVKLATQLKRLGIKKGDVISVLAQNSWRYLVSVISGFYVGATLNFLNPNYTTDEMKHLFSICQPNLIFCTEKCLEKISTLIERSCCKVILLDNEKFGKHLYFPSHDHENYLTADLNPAKDNAAIFTSSGTTGLPKCVLLTHANFRTHLIHFGDSNFMDINEKESVIGYLPFFHVLGHEVALSCIYHGAKLVILEKFHPELFLKTIEHHKITKLFAVPQILHLIAKSPLVEKYDLSTVTDVINGAAALPTDVEKSVTFRLNIGSIRNAYGLTEASGAVAMSPKNTKKVGSIGKVMNTNRLKISCIKTGESLGPNCVGELRYKGTGMMKGYLGNAEATSEAFDQEGYLRTGDLGYYDHDHFFYLVDRIKNIIKYKGFQVSPCELETLLLQHPSVEEAAVIGMPDERAGEVPVACVVKHPHADLSENDILDYIKGKVCAQKYLHGGVRFLQDIPKTSSGKICRYKLRELLILQHEDILS